MSIPPADTWAPADPELEWVALSAEAKRERILCAAGRIFVRDGLDAPMPAVAAAAGAGVASIYRQFPSKHDLIAALVVRRLDQIADAAATAAARESGHWTALIEMLWMIVEHQAGDDFLGEARTMVIDHPDVIAATERTGEAIEQLLAAARAEGRLREDATTLDLTLLFAATRAARRVDPDAWRRVLELFVDALERRG